MKLLICLILLISFLEGECRCFIPNDDLQPLSSSQEECIYEMKLDREEIAKLTTQAYPPDDNLKLSEFYSCFWKKDGFQDDDGTINYDALIHETFQFLCQQVGSGEDNMNFAQMLAKQSVDDCRQVGGTSDGQVAIRLHNCIYARLTVLLRTPKSNF